MLRVLETKAIVMCCRERRLYCEKKTGVEEAFICLQRFIYPTTSGIDQTARTVIHRPPDAETLGSDQHFDAAAHRMRTSARKLQAGIKPPPSNDSDLCTPLEILHDHDSLRY